MDEGVRLKRGAGAGCTTPSTSTKVDRAWLCGCRCASHGERTGATQASVPSKTASHSSRVLVATDGGTRSFMAGQFALSFCAAKRGSPASPRPSRSSA